MSRASGYTTKPGPRKAAETSDLDLSSLPEKQDYRRVTAFIEKFLSNPLTGEPFKLKPFQKDILKSAFPARGEKPRTVYLSIPRGQGKSTLAAALAVYFLFAHAPAPQVLCCASTQEVAQKIIFRSAVQMILSNPELASRSKITRDSIDTPWNSGSMYALASTESALHGWTATAIVVDELHVVDPNVYEALYSGSIKRDECVMALLSTPPRETTSVAQTLRDDALASPDPSFCYIEYAADPTHAIDCEHCIKSSRPLTGSKPGEAQKLRDMARRMPEAGFRRLLLGSWGVKSDDSWLEPHVFDACKLEKLIGSQQEVILAFDGSFSGDYSCLVAVSIEPKPHIQPIAVWKPQDHGGKVPILDIENAIRSAAKRFNVKEIVSDPYRFARSLEILEGEGLPVVLYPQTSNRLVPATQQLYQAFQEQQVTHTGDLELRTHFINARTKPDGERGVRIVKPSDKSPEKVDLAVCALMGFSRATHYLNKKQEPQMTGVYSW